MPAKAKQPPPHLQLRFGPYDPPRFEYGDVVSDELRGDVRIIGMTDAPIQWPTGRRLDTKGGAGGIVLFAGLVDAVRLESNQAVAHWWGVTGQTVTKWRRTLGVDRTRGDHIRSQQVGHIAYPFARPALLAKSRDPQRREKIAESRRGKKRPQHVIEILRAANTGRKPSEESRRKMSESQKRRGARPPAAGEPWTEAEDDLLRTLPPNEVAERTGRTPYAVYSRRTSFQTNDGRSTAAAGRTANLYAPVSHVLPELEKMRSAGYSNRELADWLSAAGFRNKFGNRWNAESARRLLKWGESQSSSCTASDTPP
jgi:hypothetical protein